MTALEEIAHLSNVPLDLQVELDRRTMTVREILALERGAVVKMNRSAGENIDVVIGGKRVGSGEIVIIEEAFGVRITDFNEED
ncbi:MAG TPA: flagellar motor switch protein FliN [Bryobacteraceae bacterium]|nr:flagellar motor switch protein FliN [Bryobacteraceae bacterium]